MAQATRGPLPPGLAVQRDQQGSLHGGEGKTPRAGNRALCVQVSLLFVNNLLSTGLLGYGLCASDLIPGKQRNFDARRRQKLVQGPT